MGNLKHSQNNPSNIYSQTQFESEDKHVLTEAIPNSILITTAAGPIVATSKMVIDPITGYVGIGTTSPSYPLDVEWEVDSLLISNLKNTSSAAVGVAGAVQRVTNDLGYWGLIGMTCSGSTIGSGAFVNTFNVYNQGYADTLFMVDGNKDFAWYSDPGDNHDFTAVTNEIARLTAAGIFNTELILGTTKYGPDTDNYFEVVTGFAGTLFECAEIKFMGSGSLAAHLGTIQDILYIDGVDINPSLGFSDADRTYVTSFFMNRVNGDFTFTNTGSSITKWNGDFTILDDDLYFTGDGSGLPFGSMYNHDTPTVVTIGVAGTAVRIPSGFLVGQVNATTFDSAREITVTKAGRYLITWSISFTAGAANQEVEGGIMIDNTFNTQATAHRKITTASDTGAMGGTCILDLAVDAVVALGIINETSTNTVTVQHSNMSLIMVGGT